MVAALLFLAAGRNDTLADLPAQSRTLLLDVVINGTRIGLLGEFVERHGEIYAARDELDSLGFKVNPARLEPDTGKAIKLASLPGVTYKVDEPTQTIYVSAQAAARKPTELGPDDSRASKLPIESGTGAVVNYTFDGTYADHRAVGEMLLDARLFSPWGVVESSATATNADGLQTAPVVRLDSNLTISDPSTLTQYHAGDLISGGLSWSRPVRMGGFQMSTDFGIRPDLVTFPVPTITGEVAVPSSVDVLVNGVQELSQQVPPGPFEIRQLPVITGAGDVSVVVRNAAGQQTTQTLQLYSSRQLVAPGLSDLSAEFGLVRLDYGTESNDYRTPAASVSYRRGVTKWLTFEGHAEASGGATYQRIKTSSGGMAGGGPVLALGQLGVISGDIAASHFGGRNGGLAALGFERIGPHVSLTASIQATSGKFGDIAAVYGDPVPTLLARAVLGLSWRNIGSFGVAFTEQRLPSVPTQTPAAALADLSAIDRNDFGFVPLALASRTSLLSVSYSQPLFHDRASLSVTAFRDFTQANSAGATLGISFSLGRRSSISFEADTGHAGGDAIFDATQAAPDIGDAGYDVREGVGLNSRQLAIATYRAPWGLVDAGVDRTDGNTALRADVQGALASEAGGIFASLPIYDSFAVVDTDGQPNVGVNMENRPVGRTDSAGRLLVTDLRAFDANRISIDPGDVPMDAELASTTRMVRPRDRSGVVVRFPMKSSHGAVVILRDSAGAAIPVGSTAHLTEDANAHDVPIGYGGEVFLTGLIRHNTLSVLLPDGNKCTAHFDYRPNPGRLPRIGPASCLAGQR